MNYDCHITQEFYIKIFMNSGAAPIARKTVTINKDTDRKLKE